MLGPWFQTGHSNTVTGEQGFVRLLRRAVDAGDHHGTQVLASGVVDPVRSVQVDLVLDR